METTIQVFSNPQFGQIRTAGTNEKPEFCLRDVCKALALRSGDVRKRMDSSVVTIHPADTGFGVKDMLFINEDGLYDAILDSRKPEARAFRKWITGEVLPSIRKTGGYMADSPQLSDEEIMSRALRIANETLARREERIRQLEGDAERLSGENARLQSESAEQQAAIEQKDEVISRQTEEMRRAAPKVAYYDQTLASVNTMTTTQVAKSLGMGAVELNKRLHEAGVIFRQSGMWMLRAPYAGWKMHSVRVSTHTRSDGTIGTNQYTVWNERGKRFITALAGNGWNARKTIESIKSEQS